MSKSKTKAAQPLYVREMEKLDMPEVLAIERLFCRYAIEDDPDFDEVVLQNPWAMNEAGLMELVRQRKDVARGTQSTYVLVVELPKKRYPASKGYLGEPDATVVGAMAYTKEKDGWDVVWFTLHPMYMLPSLRNLISYLKAKADCSEDRKKVTVTLIDREEAHFTDLGQALLQEGFALKLLPDHFEGKIDGFQGTWISSTVVDAPTEKNA